MPCREAGPSTQGLFPSTQGHPSFDLGELSDSRQVSKVLCLSVLTCEMGQ